MSALRTLAIPAARFTGPKLTCPIRVRSSLCRDALIQASLDPAVGAIGFVGTTSLDGMPVPLDLITVNRDGRDFCLDVASDQRPRDQRMDALALRALEALGLAVLQRTAADILADPLNSNCAAVWQHARDRVAFEDQFEVLHVLAEEGPTRLGRLALAARVSEHDIMTMACADLVEIDIHHEALGARSMIRRRDRIRLSPPQVIAAPGI